jgi:phage/plasmid-like protein (TIGR03299 family)
MPHNLEIYDGQASMFYVGTPPWHGLGTRFDTAPKDSLEALQAARLNWRVRKEPLFVSLNSRNIRVPNKYAIVREDTFTILGVVSKEYEPLQNEEAFRFFDGIIQTGAAEYETAGALGQGECVWVLAKMKEAPMLIAGFDEVQKYLLLVNSHDGSSSVHIRFTPIRVVCQNTLTMALRTGTRLQTIVHRSGLHRRLQEVRKILEDIVLTYRDIERHFQLMASVKVDGKRLQDYLEAVFPMPANAGEGDKEAQERIINLRNEAASLFTQGKGNNSTPIEGTLWAAYNGVTELVDYHYRTWHSISNRLKDVWFGEGSTIKARAYREAVSRLETWK